MQNGRVKSHNISTGIRINSSETQVIKVAAEEERLTPGEWPNSPDYFVDRSAETRELNAEVNKGVRVEIVTGAPGIGKRAFISHWLDAEHERFGDGVLYVDLANAREGSNAPLEDILRSKLERYWVRSLPGCSRSWEDVSGLYRSVTQDKKLAVFLDGASAGAEIETFMPKSEGSLVIATSTSLNVGAADLRVTCRERKLLPLSARDSRDMFFAVLRTRGIGFREEYEHDLQRLLDVCDGLPAVIEIAAKAYCAKPRQSTLAELTAKPDKLMVDEDYARVLVNAYDRLAPEERDALAAVNAIGLSCCSMESFAAVCGLGTEQAFDVARGLERAGFASVSESDTIPGHFDLRIGQLVVHVVEKRCALGVNGTLFERIVNRAAEFCVDLAVSMDYALKPSRLRTYKVKPTSISPACKYLEGCSEFEVFRRERAFITRIMRILKDSPSAALETWPISEALWSFFNSEHLYDAGIEMYDIAVDSLRGAEQPRALARLLALRANLLSKVGRINEARGSIAEAKDLVDRACACDTYDDVIMRSSVEEFIGSVEAKAGNHKLALEHYEESLAIAERHDGRQDDGSKWDFKRAILLQCTHIARECKAVEDIEKARVFYSRAVSLADAVDAHTAALTRLRAAEFYVEIREWKTAIALGQQCSAYFADARESYNQMRGYILLSKAYKGVYLDRESLAYAQEAKDFYSKNYFDAEEHEAQNVVEFFQMGIARKLGRRIMRFICGSRRLLRR